MAQPLCPRNASLHTVARGPFRYYPARLQVRDERVPWSADWPDYYPTQFTAEHVLANDRTRISRGWADPPDAASITAEEWQSRSSYEGPIQFDSTATKPLNPRGRTGMGERGYLGKWGPNHAADPIVTRFDPNTGRLQVVAIVRRDTGAVALPGGMVDAGERVSATLRREFSEEALNIGAGENREQIHSLLASLFDESRARLVYHGYVDDPRNTDHAWVETAAYHFHADGAAAHLELSAGDDAAHAFWQEVDEADPTFAAMNGKRWINAAVEALRGAEARKQQAAVSNLLMSNMRRR